MAHNTVICLIYSSHLFGTQTGQSDIDFRGVFLPSRDLVLLGKIPDSDRDNCHNKSKPGEVEMLMYSLHRFIDLACMGATEAIDMLFVPEHSWSTPTNLWPAIIKERERFITKDIRSFIGFAKSQAMKYGIKSFRYKTVSSILQFLKAKSTGSGTRNIRLSDIWEELPLDDGFVTIEPRSVGKVAHYEVCGKKLQETITVNRACSILQGVADKYGSRVKGSYGDVDWKALSHAVRTVMEVRELLTRGCITFPLEHAGYLRSIKCGEANYEETIARFQDLIIEAEGLLEKTPLPEHADRQYWDAFVVNVMAEYMRQEEK